MQLLKLILILFVLCTLNGCFLTKVVTIPMRVTGEVIGVVPVVGGVVEGAVDTAAGAIDLAPL